MKQRLLSRKSCNPDNDDFPNQFDRLLAASLFMGQKLAVQETRQIFDAANRGDITAGTVLIFVNLYNFIIMPINIVPQYWTSHKVAACLVENLAAVTDDILHLDGLTRLVAIHRLEGKLFEQYDEIIALRGERLISTPCIT